MTTDELYEFIITTVKKGASKLTTALVLRNIAIETLASMFSWDGLPETCLPEFAEQFNIIGGCFCLWKYDGPDEKYKDKFIVTTGNFADAPDVYGIGKKFIAVTFNGYVKTLEPGVDCVVCRNNSTYSADLPIILNAVDLLTEGFTSLKTNIIYSRLKPVFKCSTDQEKKAIEEAFKSIRDDLDPINITSKNVLAEIEGQDPVSVLDITDVKNADKLQFIVKAIDDIIRWIYTLYGQAIQGNAKLAQQSVSEAEGNTSTSFIIPNDRLKMRRRFCDEAKKLFNLDIAVDFSAAWKVESMKYKAQADVNGDGEIEEVKDAEPEEITKEEPDPEQEQEGEKKDEEILSD